MKLIYPIFTIIALVISGILYAQEATQPSIMVFPSDNLLSQLGCLKPKLVSGDTVFIRDYQRAMIKSVDLKFAISAIQEKFADKGFPIEDLEQALKQIPAKTTEEQIEGYATDPRTQILNVARPDIFLELTYNAVRSGMSCKVSYIIRAVDAYTLKAISTAQHPGMESIDCSVINALSDQSEMNINNLQSLMQNHFADIRSKGREIILRVKMQEGASKDLRIDKCGSLPYSMWFTNWVRNNSINGQHRRTMNTATTLEFSGIRIPLFDKATNNPISALDWVYKLVEELQKTCNVTSFDNTQGLGEAVLVITP